MSRGVRAALVAASLGATLAVMLAPEPADAVRRPGYGGTLRVVTTTGVRALAPRAALTVTDWIAVGAVHAGLYRFNSAGDAVPDLLAERLDGPARGRSWTGRLRSDARFHDGRVPQPADIARSFARLRGSAFAWIPAVITVERISELEIRLHTSETVNRQDLERLLCSPSAVVSPDGGDGRIGAGPFRVASFERLKGKLTLLRYEGHHRGAAYLDKLVFSSLGTREAAIEALVYGRAEVVLEDSPRFHGVQRLPSPVPETVGVLVRPSQAAAGRATRRAVLAAARASGLVKRLPGRTTTADRWVPYTGAPEVPRGVGRPGEGWFLGVAPELAAIGSAVAGAIGPTGKPWQTQPLTHDELRRTLESDSPGRWDGLLMRWPHVHHSAGWALRSLARLASPGSARRAEKVLARDLDWLPLVHVRPVAVTVSELIGAVWTPDGVLRLDDSWLRK